MKDQNIISTVLLIAGYIIIIGGSLAGLTIGGQMSVPVDMAGIELSDPHPLRWYYGGVIIGSSLISGLMFLGFGESIKLLDQLNKK